VDGRILRESVDGWIDPAVAFEALFADAEFAFWLERGAHGVSLMGEAGPGPSLVTASVRTGTLTRADTLGAVHEETDGSVLEFLRRHQRMDTHASSGGSSFTPGWIGWLGYELGAEACGAPVTPSPYPDAALMFADRAVSFEPATGTVGLSARDADGAADWLADTRARLEGLRGVLPHARTRREHVQRGAASGRWRHDDDAYLKMVRECQSAIARGDAYLLCLTNELRIAGRIDPLDAYIALRAVSPVSAGGLIRFGALSVVSASPEQFLQISSSGSVVTRPVKGTRPRGDDAAEDARLRAELLASAKERAENLMIVDLMRNDLGRVARLGSVEVERLLEVETYAQVHQLVSTVRAQLADGVHAIDAVAAAFPAGSMTGTPKISAMTITHGLESGARGIYSGCFGQFSADGSVDVSMVIRSIVIDDSGASIGAGGGITSLSVPEQELAEVKLKARALADVVQASMVH